MHILMAVPAVEVSLTWDGPVHGDARRRARQLRGALTNRLQDNDLFHQRDRNGKILYRYPRVQYRWCEGRGRVMGWREAVPGLCSFPWLSLELRLGDVMVRVVDAHMECREAQFGISRHLVRYRLRTPLLILNQQNYQRYRRMSKTERRREQDRLLVAQLLVALRSLDVRFPTTLYAAFAGVNSVTCRFKEQDLVGFQGEILSNGLFPDGFGFGHATSHGFGWIEKVHAPPGPNG